MNRFRIAMTVVAAVIAVNTALLGLATQQPPLFPIPPLVVVLAVLVNAGLAVVQAQMPGWSDAPRAARALARLPGDEG
jgi:hypothetical protein